MATRNRAPAEQVVEYISVGDQQELFGHFFLLIM
jgi:hypothetical protein